MAVVPMYNYQHRAKEVSFTNPCRYVAATNTECCMHIEYQRELREAREELAALIEYMLREFNLDVRVDLMACTDHDSRNRCCQWRWPSVDVVVKPSLLDRGCLPIQGCGVWMAERHPICWPVSSEQLTQCDLAAFVWLAKGSNLLP